MSLSVLDGSQAVLPTVRTRPSGQVLKWVGNKFRYAEVIAGYFPESIDTFFEPFVGTGAVLATLAPERGVASDALPTLVALHQLVQKDPDSLLNHYSNSCDLIEAEGRSGYEKVKASYNDDPNPLDLLVVSRACYGGVMRFTRDGKISTPRGPHRMMSSEKLRGYMYDWQSRLSGTTFIAQDFEKTMGAAGENDLVYCDPPYAHGQSILYGAQDFRLDRLWAATAEAVGRGARVVASVDGYRKSGVKNIATGMPEGLFKRELLVERGGCMLRRFQLGGDDMVSEQVADRLLLSW